MLAFRFLSHPTSIPTPSSKTLLRVTTLALTPFRPLFPTLRSLPSMDSQPPEIEDFVRVEGATSEDLTDSIVRVDRPGETDYAAGSGTEGSGSKPEPEPIRKALPDELSRNVVVLECESSAHGGACDVYLVGTAHVSSASVREVAEVIGYLQPEVVFLELCSSRVGLLVPQNLKVPTVGEMIEMWKRDDNLFGILYSWFLAKVGSQLEVFPGSEFRIGYEEALKYGGKVVLGDRPVQITLRRTWAKMPLWHKIKLTYSLVFSSVFMPSTDDLEKMLKEMEDADMLTLIVQEASKQFPTIMETLVHERDQYMSSTLLEIARDHSSVVAVVGKGHLPGIRRHWKQPVDKRALLLIPSQTPGGSRVRLFKSFGFAAVGVAIISGIYLLRKR